MAAIAVSAAAPTHYYDKSRPVIDNHNLLTPSHTYTTPKPNDSDKKALGECKGFM